MKSIITQSVVLAVVSIGITLSVAQANILDTIKERGTLVVGVKTDYKPYGYIDTGGVVTGIEPELAQDVAEKLGVKIKYIPVVSSNRMQFLEQGRIDLMIATMTDKPERHDIVYVISPNYYSSGTNILAPKSLGLSKWEDLRGKAVCGVKGAFYNKAISKKYGVYIIPFNRTADAYIALKHGNCAAFVFDDSAIVAKTKDPDWAEYEMPLPTVDDTTWGLAVPLGEEEFAALMKEMIIHWHKSGRILDLESKYGLTNTPFALSMHEKFK